MPLTLAPNIINSGNNLAVNSRMEIVQDASLRVADMIFTFQAGTMVITKAQGASGIAGFTKSVKFTVSTAQASLGVNDHYTMYQAIDGYRANPLNFGVSSAVGFTLVALIRPSISVAAFGISFQNGNSNRAYGTTVALAANTDNLVVLQIPPDTTGSWNHDFAGPGIYTDFCFGGGSSRQMSSNNTWLGTGAFVPNGTTNFVANNAATCEITGYCLIPNFVAIQPSMVQNMCRDYSTELTLCRRYYENSFGASPSSFTNETGKGQVVSHSSALCKGTIQFLAPKITVPTVTTYDAAGTSAKISYFATGAWNNAGTLAASTAAIDRYDFSHAIASSLATEVAYKADCVAAW